MATRSALRRPAKPSDVLIIDSTNILGQAAALRRSLHGSPPLPLRQAFAHYLAYLQLVAQPELAIAVFDSPLAARRQQQSHREGLAAAYLRRRLRQQQQHQQYRPQPQPQQELPGAGKAQPVGDSLWPFKQVAKQAGAIALVAPGGWEADDAVAAVCSHMRGAWPSASIVVASGDADVAQLLHHQTAWLQLHPRPSLGSPLGVSLVTAADFEGERGFRPAALPDWLALTGARGAAQQHTKRAAW